MVIYLLQNNQLNHLKFTTMKRFLAKTTGLFFLLMSVCIITKAGNPSSEHPYYLHALSDLRAARWMIEHRPGNWDRTVDEVEAVKQIDAAINEMKIAAIDDGKDIMDHPAVDEYNDHNGRLHEAVDFLRKARKNISRDEDNQFAQGLQGRAYMHIDAAIGATKRAIHQ
jgi:hypothetical protein